VFPIPGGDRDREHEVIVGALDALAEATRAAAQEALKFGDSFSERQKQLDLTARIHGDATDPASSFKREVQAFVGTIGDSSSVLAQQLGNIDVSNEASTRAALTAMIDRINAGNLTPADLGGLSKDDWIKFLEDGAGFLDSFNQGVDSATARLGDLNIPAGFRRGALTFQNSAEGPFVPTLPPPVPGAGLTPPTGTPGPGLHIPTDAEAAAVESANQALLEQIATSTPADLLAAINAVEAVIAQRGLPPNRPGDGAAAPSFSTAPSFSRTSSTSTAPTESGGSTTVTITVDTINVTVPGGAVTPELQSTVEDGVRAALYQIGLLQSGNTMQLGAR
jgi:hypothetical protein